LLCCRYAQAAQLSPTSKGSSVEQGQLKRAEAVQESLTKIAKDHPASLPHNFAGSLVASVKADDAKVACRPLLLIPRDSAAPQVQGAMSALHNALLPPAVHAAAPAERVVDQKKVARSVQDLTKIALQLHLKQLEAKQRALHPEPSQPLKFEQHNQQPLAIHGPGQHMPRAVAEIAKGCTPSPPSRPLTLLQCHTSHRMRTSQSNLPLQPPPQSPCPAPRLCRLPLIPPTPFFTGP
jgi:hypothetical protein